MKKTENKHGFASRLKHFFKHYFGLLVLAVVCAVIVTLVISFCAI